MIYLKLSSDNYTIKRVTAAILLSPCHQSSVFNALSGDSMIFKLSSSYMLSSGSLKNNSIGAKDVVVSSVCIDGLIGHRINIAPPDWRGARHHRFARVVKSRISAQ